MELGSLQKLILFPPGQQATFLHFLVMMEIFSERNKYSLNEKWVTEQENVWGWKGPPEVIWFTPLLKQGPLEHVPQDQVQTGSEYLQGGRLHNIFGQPVPGLSRVTQ